MATYQNIPQEAAANRPRDLLLRFYREIKARYGANPAHCPQCLRHRLQLTRGRLAEPAVRDFLKSVTEGKDKQVAADPRRLAVVEPPPFAPQFLEAERTNAIDLALDRSAIHRSHG